MKLNLFTAVLVLSVCAMTYRRLPDLTHELTRDWQAWQIQTVLTSAAAGIGVLFGLACVAVLLGNYVLYEVPANRARRRGQG